MKYSFVFILLLLVLPDNAIVGQGISRSLISFHNDKVYAGMNNYFRVVAQQLDPVSTSQLSAVFLQSGEDMEPEPIQIKFQEGDPPFSINLPNIGQLTLEVALDDGVKEAYKFNVHPISAVIMFGGNRHFGNPTNTNAFRNQRGLYTEIEALDVNARCIINSYEVVRITKNSDPVVVTNEGGVFQLAAQELIGLAKPGDRYIFTKIKYQCPGADIEQQGNSLVFEIDNNK